MSCFDDPTGSGQRERVLVINNNGPSPSFLLSLLTLTWSQHRSVTPASRDDCFRIDCWLAVSEEYSLQLTTQWLYFIYEPYELYQYVVLRLIRLVFGTIVHRVKWWAITVNEGSAVFRLQECKKYDLRPGSTITNTLLRLYLGYTVLDNHLKYKVVRAPTLGSIRTFLTKIETLSETCHLRVKTD